MSKEDDGRKQRFKGVESFLRRVAFNLGNTASQTEVKIISCIPIDVTDLQQKIMQLEKQLEEVNSKSQDKTSPNRTSVVHTAICPPCSRVSRAAVSCKANSCHQSSASLHRPIRPSEQKHSATSFLYPAARPSHAQDHQFFSTDISDMTNTEKNKSDFRKNFFAKRKKASKKKCKTQLVYYTKNEETTPFNSYDFADDITSKDRGIESDVFNGSYMADMVRRQYSPGSVRRGTNASQFSTPICRDANPTHSFEPRPESDMCSCCHGPFQNIDHHLSKQNGFANVQNLFSSHTTSRDTYYDSNLYDLVPVKENPMKIKVNSDALKRKDKYKHMDISCCPENIRPRYKIPPMIVNYHTVSPKRQQLIRKGQQKSHSRKGVVSNNTKIRPLISKSKPNINVEIRKIRSVEFSEVYAKRMKRKKAKVSKETISKQTDRDAARVATAITNSECQTTKVPNANTQERKTAATEIPNSIDNNTEDTLNQIKSILQSVLAAVKTNSKLRHVSEQTKDAVVQNGPSQSDLNGESRLLHSFTYSPYNMNPYGASCSRQVPFNNFYCANMSSRPMKCIQNYPLLVQTSRNCCYKDNNQVKKIPTPKQAATVATNTTNEHIQGRSKETENLIREIYKSVALNIEMPSKDAHFKENCHTPTNTIKKEDRGWKNIAVVVSEIFKNAKPIDTSVTPITETPLESSSKQTSHDTDFVLQPDRKYTRTRRESFNFYRDTTDASAIVNDKQEQDLQEDTDEDSDATIVNEEVTESSSSETQSDDEVVVKEPGKTKKKGLFSKMLRIFKPRCRRMKVTNKVKEQPPESDSDDYQTVYSERVAVPKPPSKTVKRTAHSKVFYMKQSQQRPRNRSPEGLSRRSPYMEQEYRRNFDETLMFHDRESHSSATRDTTSRTKRPVNYHGFEARNHPVHFPPRTETGVRLNFPSAGERQKINKQVCSCATKGMSWLGKQKQCIRCGADWKKLIRS